MSESSGTVAATPEQNKQSATISALPAAPPPVGERYELQGVLAEGGMGAIHRAWDNVLKRTVAVKVLQDRVVTPLVIKRFDYEAHITGHLQHPSIPPVHDKGTTPDGRPFLVMKLIRGRTLDDLIRAPAGGPLDVLGIFEAIAQAVGYAHSHAVIHRDLKPMNVMVGAFGEVQVMDWGLAKFRSDAEATALDASLVSTFHDPRAADEDSKTSAGSVLGTPAYMPPEQAIGVLDQVTERSDVFGLGGILCALLTGRPPFVGENSDSTRKLSAQGKLQPAFARLDASGAEPDVVALAKRCLAVEPADRPANGYEVAELVAALRLAAVDRAKRAELGRAKSDTRRRALAGGAAAVGAVLLAGIAAAVWQANRAWDAEQTTRDQLTRAERAEQAVGEQLLRTQAEEKRARAAEGEARAKTKEVEATLAVVSERTTLALEAFNAMVFGIQDKLENRPGTTAVRRELLQAARTGLAKILTDARKQGAPDRTLAWSHFRMGDVELQLGNTAAARTEYQAGHELMQRIAAAAPQDASAQRDVLVGLSKLGDVAARQEDATAALDHYRRALLGRERLAAAAPQDAAAQRDLSISLERVGDAVLQQADVPAALGYYQRAVAVRERLAAADPRDVAAQRNLSVGLNKLGDVAARQGDATAARGHYQRALAIAERLAADPQDARAQRDLSISLERVGDAALQQMDVPAALGYYQRAVAVRERLAAADPRDVAAQRDLAVGLNRLGNVLLRQEDAKAARGHYQRALGIARKLAETDPQDALAQRDLSFSLQNMGVAAERGGDFAEAIAWYEKGLTLIAENGRPDRFATDEKYLKESIAYCRGKLRPSRRETAPPPRARD